MGELRDTTLDEFSYGTFAYQELRDLDIGTLRDEERVRTLVDTVESVEDKEFSNHDYVRLSDGNVFILHGDNYPFGQLRGVPVYRPRTGGDRTRDGTDYEKYERGARPQPYAHFYESDPVEPIAYRFPVETVEERISPVQGEDAVELLSGRKLEAYRIVEDAVEAEGGALALIGSHLLGMEQADSDLDLVVRSEENVVEDVYERLRRHDDIDMELEEVTHEAGMTVVKRSHYSTKRIQKQYDVTKEVTALEYDGLSIDIISAQEHGSWTDFYLPSRDDSARDTDGLEATVVDDSRAHYLPAAYAADTENGVMDLVSFLPVFTNVLSEGDEIEIFGNYYEAHDTIYLGDDRHFVRPVDSFIKKVTGTGNSLDLSVEEQD